METSLMFVRNPKITNEMLSSQQLPLTTKTVETAVPSSSSLNYNSLIPPVHGLDSMEKSTIMPTRPQTTSNIMSSSSSNTNTANTYTAALAAAISSRSNSGRAESLVRGPLGMPMHVLAASSTTYAFPVSTPSLCLVKTSTSSPLPAPSTGHSIRNTTTAVSARSETAAYVQQTIPCQVIQDVPTHSMGHTITTAPNSKPSTSEPNYSSTALIFPATTMLPSSYSGSSSTLLPNNFIDSSLITPPTTLLNTNGSKYDPELLLSPAKLGQ